MFFSRRPKALPEQPAGLTDHTKPRSIPSPPLPTSSSATGLEVVVEACRRISAQRGRPEIHRTSVLEAIELTNAEVGAFVVPDTDDNPSFSFQSHPQFFVSPGVGNGIIGQALATRQPTCEIAHDEPSLGVSPVALAAVPCVSGSQCTGVIVVIRSADEGFGNADLEVLAMLAPVAGAAHGAAAPASEVEELDRVTRLANRRRLDRDFIDLTRAGQVGFAAVKIDYFSEFTAANGEEGTNEMLRQVALAVRASIRPEDVAYRSGPDEFGILLPEATKPEAAWVAERVRQAIACVTIAGMTSQPPGHMTVSVGVTAGVHDDPQLLLERALAARDEAEHDGKNRVVTDKTHSRAPKSG